MSDKVRFDVAPETVTPAGTLLTVTGTPVVGKIPKCVSTSPLEATWDDDDTSTGGGASGLGFVKDAAPLTPHALNDEYDGTTAAFNAKWTGVNRVGTYDVNTTALHALYQSVASSSLTMHADLQALPAGDFACEIEVTVPWDYAGNFYQGIVLTTGTTAGAGSQRIFSLITNGGVLAYYGLGFTNFNSAGAGTLTGMPSSVWVPRYVRLERSGTAYTGKLSVDGQNWKAFESGVSIGFTPTHIGTASVNNGGGTQPAIFKSFRFSTNPAELFGRAF